MGSQCNSTCLFLRFCSSFYHLLFLLLLKYSIFMDTNFSYKPGENVSYNSRFRMKDIIIYWNCFWFSIFLPFTDGSQLVFTNVLFWFRVFRNQQYRIFHVAFGGECEPKTFSCCFSLTVQKVRTQIVEITQNKNSQLIFWFLFEWKVENFIKTKPKRWFHSYHIQL